MAESLNVAQVANFSAWARRFDLPKEMVEVRKPWFTNPQGVAPWYDKWMTGSALAGPIAEVVRGRIGCDGLLVKHQRPYVAYCCGKALTAVVREEIPYDQMYDRVIQEAQKIADSWTKEAGDVLMKLIADNRGYLEGNMRAAYAKRQSEKDNPSITNMILDQIHGRG